MIGIIQSITKRFTDSIAKSASLKYDGELSDETGRIAPDKGVVWFAIIGGLFFAVIGGLILLVDVYVQGVFVTILGLCISGFMLPSLSDVQDVVWNEDGVEGATSRFGLFAGGRRHFLAWQDVVGSGKTKSQMWYLIASDGRKVYWTYYHNGYDIFHKVVKEKCGLEIFED